MRAYARTKNQVTAYDATMKVARNKDCCRRGLLKIGAAHGGGELMLQRKALMAESKLHKSGVRRL